MLAGGKTAPAILLGSEEVLRCGRKMPFDFCASRWFLITKGDAEDGRCERDLTAKPSEMRPLAMKNADDKLSCSVWLRRLRVAADKHATPGQRGFTPSRHFAQKALDLDAAARSYSTSARPAELPVFVWFPVPCS